MRSARSSYRLNRRQCAIGLIALPALGLQSKQSVAALPLLAWLFRGAIIRAGGKALARGTVRAVTGNAARSGTARAAGTVAGRSAATSAARVAGSGRIARTGAFAIPLGGATLLPSSASAASSSTISVIESILAKLYGYGIYRGFTAYDDYNNQVVDIPDDSVVLSQRTGTSVDGRVQASAEAAFSMSHDNIRDQNVLVEQYLFDLDSNHAVPVSSGAMYVSSNETAEFRVQFKSLLWPGRKTIVTKINDEIIHATEPFYVA